MSLMRYTYSILIIAICLVFPAALFPSFFIPFLCLALFVLKTMSNPLNFLLSTGYDLLLFLLLNSSTKMTSRLCCGLSFIISHPPQRGNQS